MSRVLLVLTAVLASMALGAAPASATIFTVDDAGDAGDSTIDGTCDTNGGTAGTPCTLRGAIQEANGALNPPHQIAFSVGVVTVPNDSPLPTLGNDVSIQGIRCDP